VKVLGWLADSGATVNSRPLLDVAFAAVFEMRFVFIVAFFELFERKDGFDVVVIAPLVPDIELLLLAGEVGRRPG